MTPTPRQRELWELSHRLEDLAETVQELGYSFTFATQSVCSSAARQLFLEVVRLRRNLEHEGVRGRDVDSPGRLL